MSTTSTDPIARWFGAPHMDELHTYPGPISNVRYFHRLKARHIHAFIKRRKGDNVLLDAGAGRGPYCFFASPFFTQVYCDEYRKDELGRAEAFLTEKNLTNITFKQSDLVATDYPDNFFDSIVCSEVLEHIPEREKAVIELSRILKPGGRILFSLPQKNSLFYQRVFRKHPHLRKVSELPLDDPDWETFQHLKFSTKDIKDLVTSSGLEIEKIGGVNILPLNQKMLTLAYKIPVLFYAYSIVEVCLEKLLPQYGSFYFVEVSKKTS